LNLEKVDSDGFLFHSFQGDKILIVTALKPINQSDFKSFKSADQSNAHTHADYNAKFKKLQSEIASGRFKKVILSRTKMVDTKQEALTIFNQLNGAHSNTFNYVISNSKIGTWIAATPELLLSTDGSNLKTMALAGTKTAAETWSKKEFEEQKFVTDTIVDNLNEANCRNINLDGPKTTHAGKIEHLLTNISAKMPHESGWIKVLEGLHPTPAVCGIPTTEAKQYIPKLEGYNREFYAGFIGIMKGNKKDFFVNLRCMQLHENSAKLYVGGGITAQSDQDAEWEETERKGQTLARVLKG
jgi:isochorismate synthase